jgi:hypothetical protein
MSTFEAAPVGRRNASTPRPAAPQLRPSDVTIAAILFAAVWLATFNAAYVNGDDVMNFQASYGRSYYFPRPLKRDWIPNRLFDTYGRELLRSVFNLLFFPIRQIFSLSFFWFYKIFSATLFAGFVAGVYWYVMRQISACLTFAGVTAAPTLPRLIVAAALLSLLPWTNQVRLVCYQLPAFLSFVIIIEITKRLFQPTAPRPDISDTALALLGFVIAFSLECYATIMFTMLLATAAIMVKPGGANPTFPKDASRVMLALFLCCLWAILTSVIFSDRDATDFQFLPLIDSIGFIFGGQPLPRLIEVLTPIPMIVGAAGLFWVIRAGRKFRAGRGRKLDDQPPWRFALLLLFCNILFATLAIVGLITFVTGQNYFSFTEYPWGDLLLIAELASLVFTAALVMSFRHAGFWPGFGGKLVLFVILSHLIIAPLEAAPAAFETSDAIHAAMMKAFATSAPVIDTGLHFNTDPDLQTLNPLPTFNMMQQYKDAYHNLFQEYYGISSSTVFK